MSFMNSGLPSDPDPVIPKKKVAVKKENILPKEAAETLEANKKKDN